MKSFIFIIIAFLLSFNIYSQGQKVLINTDGIQINVLQSDENLTQIEYRIGEYWINPVSINGQTYYQVKIEGEPSISEKGNPDVSKLSRSIIIPNTAKMEVSVTNTEFVETDLQVAPSKGILSRQVDPNSIPYEFSSVYSSNNYYPSSRANLGEPYIIRDERGNTVNVFPFSYNPVTKKLRIYTRILIEVKNVGTDTKNAITSPSTRSTINKYFNALYKKKFINYNQTRLVEESGRMLIICANQFLDEMQPFVNHKNSIGIPTQLVDVSTIGTTAAQISTFIQNNYNNDNSLAFVLLVGDNAQVPTHTITYGGQTGGSDPSYSLLAGNDNYPEIIVGRFSAETEAQVVTQVERSIFYESNMAQDLWWHNGTGIASGQGTGDDGEYDYQHIRNIRTALLNYHYTAVQELYDGSQGGQDATGNPTAAMVSTAINNGVSIINYTGHGNNTSWGTSGFSNTNVNALTNDNLLPFIFSVACLNGNFTGTTCFAESWLRATNSSTGRPTGAIAFYGSSINQDWAPPMQAQDEFNNLLVNDAFLTYGALCYNGSWSMMDNYGSGAGSSGASMFLTWNIFGDPSITVIPHNVSSCSENLNITQNISGGTHEFLASNSITATNTISDGADVHYGANTKVLLQAGFKVNAGNHFIANLSGCTSRSASPVISETTNNTNNLDFIKTSVDEIATNSDAEISVRIFPNPSDGLVNIEFIGGVKSFTVTITDITGKILLNKTLNGNRGQVLLTNYQSGIHFLKIKSENGIVNKKLILQ